tara:strand:+ start:3687 stop:3878 length:192 start_codon:yes stop_codon:yes gene_type:complete
MKDRVEAWINLNSEVGNILRVIDSLRIVDTAHRSSIMSVLVEQHDRTSKALLESRKALIGDDD